MIIIRQEIVIMANMKIQPMGQQVYTSLRLCENPFKRSSVRGSCKQNWANLDTKLLYKYQKRNSSQQYYTNHHKGPTYERQLSPYLCDDIYEGNISFMPEMRKLRTQESANISSFSDLKRKSHTKLNNTAVAISGDFKYRCLNHPKRRAKFYIQSNENNQPINNHHYCIECSLNLTRMNFNMYPLATTKSNDQTFQSAVSRLIKYKTNLSEQAEKLKNESNLQLIEHVIKETEDKYVHLGELLGKIKSQEMTKLQKIKMQVIDFMCEQEIKIGNLGTKVGYLVEEFGKMGTSLAEERKDFGQQGCNKNWKNMYNESLLKLGKDIEILNKSTTKYPLQLPKQLSLLEITKKLQGLFTETVHQLSFQIESKQETRSLEASEPEIKLKRYLFNDDKKEGKNLKGGNTHFNSTFGIVEGIDFALSESGSFFDQENIMINI